MTGDEALGMSGPSLAEHSLPAGDDLIGVTEVDLFGGQHRDAAMAFESASGGRILTPGRRASVLIGECTSDNGVHVHRNAISMCAPALPYVAACLTVAARPPERRRRSGAFGRRWERPPRPRAWCGHGALRVFTRWPPPSRGRSRPDIPSGKAVEPTMTSRLIDGSARPAVPDSRRLGTYPTS